MTSKLKRRWLPRFGLRSLFAVVLVVAAYFGSWPWFEERALQNLEAELIEDFALDHYDPVTVAPYWVSVSETEFVGRSGSGGGGMYSEMYRIIARRYYLWLFGWPMRLPFTSTSPPDWRTESP